MTTMSTQTKIIEIFLDDDDSLWSAYFYIKDNCHVLPFTSPDETYHLVPRKPTEAGLTVLLRPIGRQTLQLHRFTAGVPGGAAGMATTM